MKRMATMVLATLIGMAGFMMFFSWHESLWLTIWSKPIGIGMIYTAFMLKETGKEKKRVIREDPGTSLKVRNRVFHG